MLPDTRRSLHNGINFLVVPAPLIDQPRILRFQQELSIQQIEFQRVERKGNNFLLASSDPQRLEVKIGMAAPQVGQLLIVLPHPNVGLEDFIETAEIICGVFRNVWPEPAGIISRDTTIRHLYQSDGNHGFKYLWETRLGQSNRSLANLGRPVLGGGLRLFMPPREAQAHEPQIEPQIEVKIESYLRDSQLLFVETQFSWPQPIPINDGLIPRALLEAVNQYATTEVINFILQRND